MAGSASLFLEPSRFRPTTVRGNSKVFSLSACLNLSFARVPLAAHVSSSAAKVLRSATRAQGFHNECQAGTRTQTRLCGGWMDGILLLARPCLAKCLGAVMSITRQASRPPCAPKPKTNAHGRCSRRLTWAWQIPDALLSVAPDGRGAQMSSRSPLHHVVASILGPTSLRGKRTKSAFTHTTSSMSPSSLLPLTTAIYPAASCD